MAEQDAELLQISLPQARQDLLLDGIVAKRRLVLAQPQGPEPGTNLGEGCGRGRRSSGQRGDGGGSFVLPTAPVKRSPLRCTVRISARAPPLSPIAWRAALIAVVIAESETIRPPHTASSSSSLPTTRSRLRTSRRSDRRSAAQRRPARPRAAVPGGRCRADDPRRRDPNCPLATNHRFRRPPLTKNGRNADVKTSSR
jgi:hypothetical protein